MNCRRHIAVAIVLMLVVPAAEVGAAGFTDIGADIEAMPRGGLTAHGYMRARGQLLGNLDLDRGVDPAGRPLYPVPISDPSAQTLTHADLRLRADVAAYSPIGDAAVKVRLDLLDNLAAGSTPDGPPQATVTQRPVDVIALRRAYAEVLTPFGLLSFGRMGAHWGTGMLSNGGDCSDCTSGDAADRLGFVTPLVGHIWAVAYDIGYVGPTASRRDGSAVVDIDPSDNVQSVSAAVIRYRTPRSRHRRRAAGVSTLDYGIVASHRWQRNDVPAHYLPVADGVEARPISVERGLRAWLFDGYVDFSFPTMAVRAEAAVLTATIDEPSVIPGVAYGVPLESLQWGGVLMTDVGGPSWPLHFGIDGGVASGDAAPGFGAFPGPLDGPAEAGEVDGQQANPPYDNTVANLALHPDFHVDRILFREIIGRVTDAVYMRPHVSTTIGGGRAGALELELAAVVSSALQATSTPSGQAALGLELDPTIRYQNGGFSAEGYYALFVPGAAFDNPTVGLSARPAHLAGLQLQVVF